LPNSSQNEKRFKRCKESQLHFLCRKYFLNHVVYEIMWKNNVKPQMTIWRMRTACLKPKATNTLSEYVILHFFRTATTVKRTRFNVTIHLHCLSHYF